MKNNKEAAKKLAKEWKENSRWKSVKRPYKAEDVLKLRGSLKVEYTIATETAKKLWKYINNKDYVNGLGALSGNQAMQMIKAGLKTIYLSGWQVAADANLSGNMYPDQSLYPANSAPELVRSINKTLMRADQIHHTEGKGNIDWFQPIVADAEAGFGGNLNAFELMKDFIDAGAAGVHFEDQLSSAKKCGHMGGKVLIPIQEHVQKIIAARLAADVLGVPTIIVARTDANGSYLITSDIDERDKKFIKKGKRTTEGFYEYKGGIDAAINRAIYYAPYTDLIWCETSTPDLKEAKKFAESVRKKYPNQIFAYNCSPSFNWKKNLNDTTIAKFQKELAAMGYKYQFVTLAGFHALNYSMFELARGYKKSGMSSYVELQEQEFDREKHGYTATKHQREVGAGYFDAVAQAITSGASSTTALKGSTEEEQF